MMRKKAKPKHTINWFSFSTVMDSQTLWALTEDRFAFIMLGNWITGQYESLILTDRVR